MALQSLQIEELTFAFGTRKIIDGFSFQADAGNVVAVVGANGTGKSTLLSLIVGLRPFDKGQIAAIYNGVSYAGRELNQFTQYLAAERNGLFLNLSALQNLRFWAKLKGRSQSDKQIRALLEQWGFLHPLVQSELLVGRFSTGMKRRLAMARLELLNEPLLILDEPMHGMDAKGQELVVDLLKRHQRNRGITFIVTHEIRQLEGVVTNTIDSSSFMRRVEQR